MISSWYSLLLLALTISSSTQSPCKCNNPWQGSVQAFLGDPSKNCDTRGVCYVLCDSDCSDIRAAVGLFAGQGKCVSSKACRLDGGFVPDRPVVIVVGGLSQNCKRGSKCEQENIVNYIKENIQNCQGSNCDQYT